MNVHSLKMQFSGAASSGEGPCNNNNTASSNNKSSGSQFLRTHIPVSSFRCNRNNINNSILNSSSNITPAVSNHESLTCTNDKWKIKFEEEERKRKTLLMQNQKLTREYEEFQRRFSVLQDDLKSKVRQLNEKEHQLIHLRKLSEAVCKEYDQMKTQYDLETNTMQKAMKRASQWYKENKELKRRSTLLIGKVMQLSPDIESLQQLEQLSGDQTDNTTTGLSNSEQGSDDIEELNKMIQELNKEVARLQAELNAARLQEFEAQEQTVELITALDEERTSKKLMGDELQELRRMKDNLSEVSKLVAAEVSALKEQSSRDRQMAEKFKVDADKAKKERNVLAHQSQLLMTEVASDDRLTNVLLEVEQLMSCLEEERHRHASELQQLQEKLDALESNDRLEILEQRLKLTESELVCAVQRADRAELQANQLSEKTPGAAIDDIINQIKGGRFTLKATEKQMKVAKTEEMPPAVQEMMTVLGTLRRRPKNKQNVESNSGSSSSGVNTDSNATVKTRVSAAPADVAL
ncbi:shootin-1-like isoform X2 [Lycorma delicatula]|uniref:shootin-1-like isoform X2 n=1 Tax=Lycorma delicatula TaxID=130591 RepID=UPI003F512C88